MRIAPLLVALVMAGCSFPAAPRATPEPAPTVAPGPSDASGVELRARHLQTGDASDVLAESRRVVATQQDWESLWALHTPTLAPVKEGNVSRESFRARPVVDFAFERVVAAFAGEVACKRIAITSVVGYRASGVTVVTVTTYPLAPCPSSRLRPFDLVAIPADGSQIVFREATADAAPPGIPLDAPPCGRIDVAIDRAVIRPGEDVNVTATFLPCGEERPALLPSCQGALLDGFVRRADARPLAPSDSGNALGNGSTLAPLFDCATAPGEAGSVPAGPLERHWRWNGTLGLPCYPAIYNPQPPPGNDNLACSLPEYPGAYELGARVQDANWTLAATVPVTLLPARVPIPVLRIEETLRGAPGDARAMCSEGTVAPDGTLALRPGAVALVERNLTTDNGTALLRVALFQESTGMTTPAGKRLYDVTWDGVAFRVDGATAPTHREAVVTQDAARVSDTLDAMRAAAQIVELSDGHACGASFVVG